MNFNFYVFKKFKRVDYMNCVIFYMMINKLISVWN